MSLSAEEYDAPHHAGPSKAFIDSVLQPESSTTTKLLVPFAFCREIFIFLWKFLKQTISTLFLEWLSDSLGALGEVIDWKKIKRHRKALPLHHQNPGYRYAPKILPSPLEASLTLYKVTQNTEKDGLIMPDQNDTLTERHLSTLRKTNPWLNGILRQSWVMAVQPPLEPSSTQMTRTHKKIRGKVLFEEPNRGLDDIFTNPIHNFFDGDKDFSFSKPAGHKQQADRPKFKSSSPITARLDKELRHLISLCKKPISEAAPDSPSPEPAGTFDQTPISEQAFSIESQETTLQPPTAEPIAQTHFQETQASWQTLQETASKITLDATASRLRTEDTASNAHKPKANDLWSKTANAKSQVPIYQEMTNEISGTEHMVRNNRILHNSISKLTDAYFQKAAQEAAPDYY